MDNYITKEEFDAYAKGAKNYTDAVVSALIKTFHPLTQERWEEFCNNFDEELRERQISMGEDCIGKKQQLR